MANKRDTSKQKRARQNRAQREALKARTASASEPKSSSRTSSSTKSSSAAVESAPKKKGGFLSGGQPRPPRPGDVPVDIATLEGNWFSKRVQVPGGRQILTAAVLTIVMTVMLAFQKFPPANDPKADPTLSITDRFGSWTFLILALPIAIVAIASVFTLHPQRRRIWLGCTFLLAAAVIALLGVYFFYLITVGYLGYAVARATKIEGPDPRSRAARAAQKAAEPQSPTSD